MLVGWEKKTPDERSELKTVVVNILAHVFTNRQCWYYDCDDADASHMVGIAVYYYVTLCVMGA
jgi:hypothetical protein